MRLALAIAILAGLGVSAVAVGAAPIKARMTTSTATPEVDQPWRWQVTVRTAAGRPLRAKMKLQILLGETVVGCWKGAAMVQCSGHNAGDWIVFRGRRSGILTWPSQSVGVKLTFQAVVRALQQTRKLRAPVTVQPAPAPGS